MNELVEIRKNQVVTSSRQVAEVFGKLHKHVIESIREILSAENSANKFFCKTSYTYRGRILPEYLMNRDGFSLLVMGFTGKKALEWKIKYIEAFNAMEKALKEKELPALPTIKKYTWLGRVVMPITYLEQLCGIQRSRMLFALKYAKIPYVLMKRGDMDAFKKENGFVSCASRAVVLTKEAVYFLLKRYDTESAGLVARLGPFVDEYFDGPRPDRRAVVAGVTGMLKRKTMLLDTIVDRINALNRSPGMQLESIRLAQDFVFQMSNDLIHLREELSE